MINKKYFVRSVISAAIGLISIILGIIGLATPTWIKISPSDEGDLTVYGLFRRCTTIISLEDPTVTICDKVTSFKTAQGLLIAGVIIIAIGVAIAIILKLFSSMGHHIYLIFPILPMIGSILILIGFLLYIKYLIEHYVNFFLKVDIGYSIIIMVIACIFGFVTTAYFSFNAGYIYRSNRHTHIII
jgi:hypothetical protein